MKKRMMVSVACIKSEVANGNFVGCGYGRVQAVTDSDKCERCGRVLKVTGTFIEIDLRSA